MRPTFKRHTIGVVIACVGIVGCTDERGVTVPEDEHNTPSESRASIDPIHGTTTATVNPEVPRTTGSRSVSPLSQAFASIEESDASDWDEALVQEYIAVCMREEGFEYWPYVEQETLTASDWERPIFPIGEAPEPADEGAEDPNHEYRETLSDSEQGAYLEALTGQDPDVPVVEGSPEGDSDVDATGGSGCDGKARRRYEAELASEPVDSEETNAALVAQLDEAVNTMLGQLETDEEVVNALTAYSGCLADSGFPATFPSSAYDTVYWMPAELVFYLQEQGADLLNALASDPASAPEALVGVDRIEELRQLERTAREAHAECVGPLEEAVRAFEIEYARSDGVLSQYLSE